MVVSVSVGYQSSVYLSCLSVCVSVYLLWRRLSNLVKRVEELIRL